MEPFYIDSCCKKTRVMLIVAGLLLAVIGSRFRIPWVLCSGPFAIIIFLCRKNTRYYFLPSGIEKRRCYTNYDDVFPFVQRLKSESTNVFVRAHNQFASSSIFDTINRGKLKKAYLKEELQNVSVHEGTIVDTIILQFSDCKPMTERFLWLHCLHNRKSAILIRYNKNRAATEKYLRLLDMVT